MPTMNYIQAI
ncbi:Protein of unknown function [Cotesia congregata]|uniref:Uncharacterized protein n=1 Tax=Cotesia congregata TaxID=51543 RepID=A0A8J2HUH4_COTCN|nr:Protein of unknown function [Cotesia congregata]